MSEKKEVVSYIKLSEIVDNEDHKFGETSRYQPCYIEFVDNTIKGALFTENEILKAITRARKNPEDMGARDKSLLEDLSDFFNF